jgi:hypothetical protein
MNRVSLSRWLLLGLATGVATPGWSVDLGDQPDGLAQLYQDCKNSGTEAPAWLLEKLFPGSTLDVPDEDGASRQGGVSPATAVLIPGLPFSDTGTTRGQNGSLNSVPGTAFNEPTICPQVGAWAAGNARDRSYRLELDHATTLTIDLCGSGYDTAVGVFEDLGGGTLGACVARDDDGCGSSYRSIIETCELPAGSYFIVVDGYGTSTGSYTLIVDGPCEDPGCPAGFDTTFEREGNGANTNGGCNMDVPSFESLTSGVALCGTIWADGGTRDTDWYTVEVPNSSILTATLATNCVPMNLVLVDEACPATQLTYVSIPAYGSATLTSGCLASGTYRLVAVPQGTSGYPASDVNHYGLIVEKLDCALPCEEPVVLSCGSVVDAPAPTANNFTAGVPSCTGYSHNGFDHEYVLNIAEECDVTITMDNYGTRDAALLIRTDCLDANSCIAGADATVGGEPEVIQTHLLPGSYYVIADFYNNSQGEAYLLTVECSGGVVEASDRPAAFGLLQNVPNPFNPTTTIHFAMGETGTASLKVFDLAGREVATLVNGTVERGGHSVSFDASNLSSGVYFYNLQAAGSAETRKMVLMK